MFNFNRLDKLLVWIGHLSQKLWSFEFAFHFHVLFWASRYSMSLNRTSKRKLMTIWISRELPLLNFKSLDIIWVWIGHPRQKLWLFEFVRSSHVQFRSSWYIIGQNQIFESKVMVVWIFLLHPSLISSVSIYYAPESDIRVKDNDHLNFSRAFVVQFWASRYIMGLNHTPESKVTAVWLCR